MSWFWYFGSEAFREKLVRLLERDRPSVSEKRRKGYSAAQTRDHGVTEARRIFALAEGKFGNPERSSLNDRSIARQACRLEGRIAEK